jgi:hypothetical protein
MLSCYRKRDWNGALEALHLCRHTQNNFGLDEIYNLYLARIQSFQEKGPPTTGMACSRSKPSNLLASFDDRLISGIAR